MGLRLPCHFLASGLVVIVMAVGHHAAAAEKVDVALVLAVDVSASMDREEQEIQRNGYIGALTHPETIAAIHSGPNRRIAVTYVEWSDTQQVIIPWTIISDQASANAFANVLADSPYSSLRGTSISGALEFSRHQLETSGFDALRRAIDVSGDGPNNTGAPVEPIRHEIVASDMIINGLPITIRPSMTRTGPTLEDYYRDCVIGGPGSFVIPIKTPDEFSPSIRRKLVLEISGLQPRVIPAAMVVAEGEQRTDCQSGDGMFWRHR